MPQKVTTIKIFGRYEVVCQPDPEPEDTVLNDVEAYFSIDDLIRKKLIIKHDPINKYSGRAIQAWLDKFPKPLNSK